ncbi:MAG TPA: hypothetical protein VMM13_05585, partial [Euzebya sp.]|nr:hypothetical protein [Euzebya sp.]
TRRVRAWSQGPTLKPIPAHLRGAPPAQPRGCATATPGVQRSRQAYVAPLDRFIEVVRELRGPHGA